MSAFQLLFAPQTIVGKFGPIPFWVDRKCKSFFRGIYKHQGRISEFSVENHQGHFVGDFPEVQFTLKKIDRPNSSVIIRNDIGNTITVKISSNVIDNGRFVDAVFSIQSPEFSLPNITTHQSMCMMGGIFFSLFFYGISATANRLINSPSQSLTSQKACSSSLLLEQTG